jgi:hypothetical protein
MRETSKLVALAGGIAFAASLAYAADQTILGKSLTVKDPTAGVDPAKRSIKGSAKEKGSSGTLVGNPTLAGSAGGALLDIFANGTHSTSQEFVLPQGSSNNKPFWTAMGTNPNFTGFKYKDNSGANHTPVKSVLIKKSANGAFSIKVKLAGKNGTINVVPPDSGISGCMALKLGQGAAAGDRYSVQFGPESKIKNVDAKVFSAKKPTLTGICPTVVTTTSTTTSTTHASSSSTTTTHASTTTTTSMYGSPSRAFLEKVEGLLD